MKLLQTVEMWGVIFLVYENHDISLIRVFEYNLESGDVNAVIDWQNL